MSQVVMVLDLEAVTTLTTPPNPSVLLTPPDPDRVVPPQPTLTIPPTP